MKDLIWSYGGGTQSIAIAVLVSRGDLPTPKHIVIADTEYEASSTWDYLENHVNPLLKESVGKEVTRITTDYKYHDLQHNGDGKILLPVFQPRESGGIGKLPNFCTKEWKIYPVRRHLNSLGYGRGNQVRLWIGISIDEVHRAKPSGKKWIEHQWPLLFDYPLRREECISLVKEAGLPDPPKSSCYFCPFRTAQQWNELKKNYPEDFENAVDIEKKIREDHPNMYVHRSCVPLDQIDQLPEPQQTDMFGEDIECDSGYCWV